MKSALNLIVFFALFRTGFQCETVDCSAYYQPRIHNVTVDLESDLQDCESERSKTIEDSYSMLQNKKDEHDTKMTELNEYLNDCQQKEVHYDAVLCYQNFEGSLVVMQTTTDSRTALKQHELSMYMVDMVFSSCKFTASNKANMKTQELFSDYSYCVINGRHPPKRSRNFM